MNNHPHADALNAAIDIMKSARAQVLALLTHEQLATIRLAVDNKMAAPVQYLNGLMGIYSDNTEPIPTFEPLTHMMGHKIELRQPIMQSQLRPDATEKEIFLGKRNELYARFTEMTDDQINEFERTPQGGLLIRSVAKLAGLLDYREVALTIPYYDKIKEAIVSNKAAAEAVLAAEKETDTILASKQYKEDTLDERKAKTGRQVK